MLPAPLPKQYIDQQQAMQKQTSQQNIQRQNTGGQGNGGTNNTANNPSTPTSQPNQQQQRAVLKHVDNYIIFNEKLGGGQFSQVYLGMDKNDKTHSKFFAIKTIPMSSTQYQKFANYNDILQKEIEILLKARHPNLICMHDLKQTPNNLYLFLDYCNGGDLRQHLNKKKNRLSEEEAIEFFKQLSAGYQALNEKKIIHRDLKPENILLDDNKIKIGDFGFARIVNDLDQAVRMTQKCSPLYAPPQILLNEKYSSKCDVWSMGCIFFEMLYGKPPFTAHSIISLTDNIKKTVGSGPYKLPQYPPIAQEAKDILVRMLMYHEKDRISWDEIFSHPILQKHLQKKVVDNVQIEQANNPLYQSIRKNLDAVWETVFKPNQPVMPPIQTIAIVPGSNQTLFNKDFNNQNNQNEEKSQKEGGQLLNQQERMVSTTPSSNINILGAQAATNNINLIGNNNVNNGIGVVSANAITNTATNINNNNTTNTTNNNTPAHLTKAVSTPANNSDEDKSISKPEIQIQRHERRYSQYGQTIIPQMPANQNNNQPQYQTANQTDRTYNGSTANNQNKENILKRANSINVIDNNIGLQNKQNNNNFDISCKQPVGIPQTERRKEAGRSHTINYTGNQTSNHSNNFGGGINTNGETQNYPSIAPKSPYTPPPHHNHHSTNNKNVSNNLSFNKQSGVSGIEGQPSSLSYRDRSNTSNNSLVEKYTNSNNIIQQQKENIYNGFDKEKANFLQTAPLANMWSTGEAVSGVSGTNNNGVLNQNQKIAGMANQVNGNNQYSSTKHVTSTTPNTPSSHSSNYFQSSSANNANQSNNTSNNSILANYSNINAQTLNNTSSNKMEGQTLNSIPNKDKEIIAKIEENKDLSENEKYVLYLKQMKIKEAERAFVSKIDNFFSFMRKRALFANATLLNFWNSTRQFKLPSDFQCSILYCLCCYYYYGLEYLKKILFKETEQKVIKKDGFEVYQRSQEFKVTKEIIQRDVQEAKQLFTDIEPFMISEIQLSTSPEAQDFMKFIQSKPTKHDDFRVKLQSIFYKSLQYIDMNSIDRTASKGIHMTQLFTHIEDFIPSKQYNEFDFNKFYDDRFNNVSLDEFKVQINSFNLQYYSFPNKK